MPGRPTRLTRVVLVAAAYYAAAQLGLLVTGHGEVVSAIWVPAGIAVASLVVWGPQLWPGVALGAVAAGLTSDLSVVAGATALIGEIAFAVGAAVCLRRVRGFDSRLRTVASVIWLAAVAVVGAVITASAGTAALALDGQLAGGGAWATANLWWSGDVLGVLIAAPAIMIWRAPRPRLATSRTEAALAALAIAVSLAAAYVFAGGDEWLVVPALTWVAIRFGAPGVSLAALVISLFSGWMSARGHGPFINDSGDAEVAAQAFAAATAFSALLLAVAVRQRAHAEQGRREAEATRATLEEAQELAGIATWEWWPDTDEAKWSGLAWDLLQLDPADAPASPATFAALLHPADMTVYEGALDQLRAGAAVTFDCRVRRGQDGQYMWVQLTGRGETADGRVVRCYGTAQDLAREGSPATEDHGLLWHSFEYAPGGIAMISTSAGSEGTILRVNPAYARLMGRAAEDLVGQHIAQITLPEDAAAGQAAADRLQAGDSEQEVLVKRYVRPDGSVVHAVTSIGLVRDAAGIRYGISHVQDIGDRVRAEEAYRRSSESFRAAFETSQDAMVVVDDDRRYVAVNSAACELFGVTHEQLLSMQADDFLPDPSTADDLFRARIASGGGRGAITLRRPDGRLIEVETSSRANFAAGQHLSVMRDVTERTRAERDLRRSDERYRQLIATTREGVWITNREGRTEYVNKSMARMLGIAPEEAVGVDSLAYVHPDWVRFVREQMEHRRHGESGEYELQMLRADGSAWWAHLTATPQYDEDGSYARTFALLNDISAEKAVAEVRAEAAAIVSGSDDAIVSTTTDGRVRTWNRGAEKLYGYSVEEAIGEPIADLVAPEGMREKVQALQTRAVAGESIRDVVVERRTKSGGRIHLSLNLTPIGDADGTVTGVARIARDISERMLAEASLAESEQRFREIVETANEGVWAVDADGRTTFVNARMAEMVGVETGEMLGRSLAEFSADPEEATKVFFVRSRRPTDQLETVLRHADGSDVHVYLSMRSQFDSDGHVTGALAMVVDISGRVRAEQEAASLSEQLHQIQKLETVGQLAGGIAHDFNNLLAVILNYAEFALLSLEDGAIRDDIAEIKQAAERATDLTQQLLLFSRREMVAKELVDVGKLMLDLERLLRRTLGEQVRLEVLPSPRAPRVEGDRSQLEQVLMNLAVNARDAMPAGGQLLISTRRVLDDDDRRWLRIVVSDTGMGMPQEIRDRAFEPFFTTKPPGTGTGLGLATVYGIVTGSGGHLKLESELGAGTTVTIDLPAAPDDRPTSESAEYPALERPLAVMVVDDEPAILRVTRRILDGAGFEVLEADGPLRALELAGDHHGPLDVVLTDIVMPEMSGIVLAQKLAAVRPESQVIFMSGYTDRFDRLPEGAVFIPKPFTAEALLERLRVATGGS